MTIDDVRAAAEKAKAMDLRSKVCHRVWRSGLSQICALARVEKCAACLGAKRAVEDIASFVNGSVVCLEQQLQVSDLWKSDAVNDAFHAARIASYFASDPNPVSEFRDTVRKFVEAGK